MKPHVIEHRWLGTVPFAALCFCITASANAGCPVPADRQGYVTEIVQKLTFDLAFVGSTVHGRDRGFALSLFGIDTGFLGQLLLVQECTERQVFEPFLESILDPPMTIRSQIICEGPGVDVVKIEAASVALSRHGDFSKLTYPATRFSGTVLYEPFPTVDWRTVKTDADDFMVSAAIYRRLTFTPTGKNDVDLTHIGALSLAVVDSEPAWGLVQAAFPNVAIDGQPISVEVQINAAGDASGVIKSADNTLAVISGTAFETIITWNCLGSARAPRTGS